MSKIDQRNQMVHTQYNAGGDIFIKNGNSGIEMVCKMFTRLAIGFYTTHPMCLINTEEIHMQWNTRTFIPLEPDTEYSITTQYIYFGVPSGEVNFNISLKPGEIKKFLYKAPFIAYTAGTIKQVTNF